MAQAIVAHQMVDWREWRFEPFDAPQVGKLIAKMAEQIVAALEREHPKRPTPSPAPRNRNEPRAASAPSASVTAGKTEQPSAPIAKTEPPTWVVDALHRGDHTTISEALKNARPGDRILIRPGLYKEGIVIDKPLEIIGDGELGDVVIEAVGQHTVVFKAKMGRITNLTLRQAGGGHWYGVDIGQGHLELEACDITSRGLSCVGIHDTADSRLRRNRIHDGKQSGVVVYANGQGTMEDNDIFGNASSGVEVKGRGNLILRRNRVTGNGATAISVCDDGAGVIEDNDLRGNDKGAWYIANDCKDKVRRARNQE